MNPHGSDNLKYYTHSQGYGKAKVKLETNTRNENDLASFI
jgi:hypothetical protein